MAKRKRIDFIGRKKKMLYPATSIFAQFIRQVNEILTDNPAFRHGENCHFVDNGHPAIIAAFRNETGTQTSGFLVVCNFDIQLTQSIEINSLNFSGNKRTFPMH